MSLGAFLKANQRLFRGPLVEQDGGRPRTPAEGRWSDDWRDLPPAENGVKFHDEIRLIHTGVMPMRVQHTSISTRVNLMLVAGSCMNSFPIADLPGEIIELKTPPGSYKPHLDEPWRKKKPWRR